MMNSLRKHQIISITLIVLSLRAFAGGDAGQAGAFLRYGVGVRAYAMGRAQTAFVDDASSVYYNPAGLLESEYIGFSSMYSNLYYDSRYAFIGLALPRISDSLSNPVLKYFLGPQSAWGMGWIGLSMVGFEQRTEFNEFLGNFDLSENAWLISWAREHAGQWGVFRYGFTYKFVHQQFPGLNHSDSWNAKDGTGGVDFGCTFQPIHMPGFRIISLRYLLPLRFGFVVQNLYQPGWEKSDKTRNLFPRTFRYGVSYRWHMQDWIPDEWAIKPWIASTSIMMLYDYESYCGTEKGSYWGFEGDIPLIANKIVFLPRFGFNNRSEGSAFGFGMRIPFSKAAIQLDYAYQSHDFLPNDARFNLSVQLGQRKGAEWFREKSRNSASQQKSMEYHHLVLSKYPNKEIENTVRMMSDHVDRNYERRLNEMVGGLRHATLLLEDARQDLYQIHVKSARKHAQVAASEFSPLYLGMENQLNDTQLLDYGEALLISEKFRDAITVLREIETPNLRYYFLLGTAYNGMKDPNAIDVFSQAVQLVRDDEHSMASLAYLGWAEALVDDKQYIPAVTALKSLLNYDRGRLDKDYPRLPIIKDFYLQDDALFLLGIAQLKAKQISEGISSLLKTQRFYPTLEYGRQIDLRIDEIYTAVQANDIEQVQTTADELLILYLNRHDPSNQIVEK